MTDADDAGLAAKMREYANGHPHVRERFNELAENFEKASAACFDGTGSVPKMLGAWAKARRAWCEETGEQIV
jgi:hypothetical protein